jgi:hypothetical protein
VSIRIRGLGFWIEGLGFGVWGVGFIDSLNCGVRVVCVLSVDEFRVWAFVDLRRWGAIKKSTTSQGAGTQCMWNSVQKIGFTIQEGFKAGLQKIMNGTVQDSEGETQGRVEGWGITI